MPRIRTLKPEFWADEKLAPMPVLERLVFLGLISMADDAGRVVDNVKLIDGFLFPETDDSSRVALATLAKAGRILRYVSESGQRLIQVANWERHQKVDHPSKYVLPAPSPAHSEAVAELSRDIREDGVKDSRLDLRPVPATYDQTASSPPSTAAREAFDELRAAVPAEYHPDVDDLLARVGPAARDSWTRSLLAALSGLHPPTYTGPQVGAAVREFNQNGGTSAKLFKGYLRNAATSPPLALVRVAGGAPRHAAKSNAGDRTFENGIAAFFGEDA